MCQMYGGTRGGRLIGHTASRLPTPPTRKQKKMETPPHKTPKATVPERRIDKVAVQRTFHGGWRDAQVHRIVRLVELVGGTLVHVVHPFPPSVSMVSTTSTGSGVTIATAATGGSGGMPVMMVCVGGVRASRVEPQWRAELMPPTTVRASVAIRSGGG